MLKPVFLSAALLALSPMVFADTSHGPSAEALVAEAAVEITQADRETVADAVLSHLDIDTVARFTLGRYVRDVSEEAQADYTAAFERYMRRQIVANADQFVGVELAVTNTNQRNAKDAIVTTWVSKAGENLILRWRVIERGGQWNVVDLEFSGLWLAIEQRAQVSAILGRPNADIQDVIAQFG
jgi:phospholipid transport system substrate-binding protein